MKRHSIRETALVATLIVLTAVAAFGAMNFVRDAGTVNHSNSAAAVSSGEIVDLTDRYGVAIVDIASNAWGIVRTEGVFDLKLSATNVQVSVGQDMFYSSATNVTTTGADDKYIGKSLEAVSAGKTTIVPVEVELNASRRSVSQYMILGGDAFTTNMNVLTAFDGAAMTTSSLGFVSGVLTNGNQ